MQDMLIKTHMNKYKNTDDIKRGQVFYVDLTTEDIKGCEQSGTRPCVIIQNDVGNKFSPTVIVAMITSKEDKTQMPTHVKIKKRGLLKKDSYVLAEQVKTVDKLRLRDKVITLSPKDMRRVNQALAISIGLR